MVDSGYLIGALFLPPHKATRYHAQEFRRSNRQPALGKELFKYRHSSLHMVIERSFGVFKARFPILSCMANYKESRQRWLFLLVVHYTILYVSIMVEMKCLTHGRTLTLIEMMYKLGIMGILLNQVQVLKGGM